MGDNKNRSPSLSTVMYTGWAWEMQWVILPLRTHWRKRCVSAFC